MAKTKGPLLSLDAHGSLAKILTYSNKKTGQQVRKYNKPLVDPTAKQKSRRRLNEFATIQWLCMSPAAKATWEASAKASKVNLPGYHYFLREALRDPYNIMDLVGYWPLNEIISNQVQDLSSNGLHFDLKPTPPSDAPKIGASLQPKFGKALSFDGVNDYSDAVYKAPFDITLRLYFEIWCKPTLGDWGSIFQQYNATEGVDAKIIILLDGTGYLIAYYVDDAGTQNFISSAAIDSNVHCIALRLDATTARFFIDGQPDSNSETFTPPLSNSIAKPWIGSQFGGGFDYKGLLAQMCYYKRAPSNAEILKRYEYGKRSLS